MDAEEHLVVRILVIEAISILVLALSVELWGAWGFAVYAMALTLAMAADACRRTHRATMPEEAVPAEPTWTPERPPESGMLGK